MKIRAKVVKVNGEGEQDKNGFSKQIHILNEEDQVIWKSNSTHPESTIQVTFNNYHFICPPSSYDYIYIMLDERLKFE